MKLTIDIPKRALAKLNRITGFHKRSVSQEGAIAIEERVQKLNPEPSRK